jgi:hypothetical protein
LQLTARCQIWKKSPALDRGFGSNQTLKPVFASEISGLIYQTHQAGVSDD